MSLRSRYLACIDAHVERWEREPMAWDGARDCCLSIADIDLDVTGIDTGAPWRGRYAGEAGARALMGRRGVYGILSRAARIHGWPRIAPEAALAGDRGCVRCATGVAAAIFDGFLWAARTEHGVVQFQHRFICAAWSIEGMRCLEP